MEDKDKEKDQKRIAEQANKKASELPFCTTAPSAEHARASNEDEPCDDSRGGT